MVATLLDLTRVECVILNRCEVFLVWLSDIVLRDLLRPIGVQSQLVQVLDHEVESVGGQI